MAVFTRLDHDDINKALQRFELGEVLHFEGITAGMENSNYFVSLGHHHPNFLSDSQKGEYVLTLFEELPAAQLPFYIKLLKTLKQQGIAVAAPIDDVDGQALQCIAGKPAVLCPKLPGEHPVTPNIRQCEIIGQTLAAIHNALHSLEAQNHQGGIRDTSWLQSSIYKIAGYFSDDEYALTNDVFQQYMAAKQKNTFSQSVLHGDLFHDNALFNGDKLSGIIDFYNAGFGDCIYDLAIVVNDWCLDDDGQVKTEHYYALVSAYTAIHPLNDTDKQYWPIFLQITALRFWVSRSLARHRNAHTAHASLPIKDPLQYKQILLQHRQNAALSLL